MTSWVIRGPVRIDCSRKPAIDTRRASRISMELCSLFEAVTHPCKQRGADGSRMVEEVWAGGMAMNLRPRVTLLAGLSRSGSQGVSSMEKTAGLLDMKSDQTHFCSWRSTTSKFNRLGWAGNGGMVFQNLVTRVPDGGRARRGRRRSNRGQTSPRRRKSELKMDVGELKGVMDGVAMGKFESEC